MNSIILHISDLHVSLDKKIGGEINKHDSYFTTDPNEEQSNLFIDKFINTVNTSYSSYKIYLLITGDISNEGEKKEFDFAIKFIERIIKGLNINKNEILLIPGDHDLNRREIQNLLSKNEDSDLNEINKVKFKNFKEFYEDLFNKEFDPNKIICNSLIVEGSFILLGLNSCTEIDLKQKLGSIPIDKFEDEFEKLDKSKKMIACVHHNLTSSYENTNNGKWDTQNRLAFIDKILSYNINFVFTGNEHTNSCKSIMLGEITTSDSGSISSVIYDTTFKIYKIVISEDIILENKIFALQKTNGNDSKYEWDIRTNSTFKQPDQFELFIKKPPIILDKIDDSLPVNSDFLTESKFEKEQTLTQPLNIYNNPEFTDELYEKVKELKLYHTGHFHWSETSRSHNWIDVSKLIEDKNNLNFIKNAVIDVFEKKINPKIIDLIIGLGYEGNIIATKLAIKYNKPYSFLPYSYRYDEHHEFETELNFKNNDKKYRNILIITDVVNDGRTIRKLINKRQKDFFINVEKNYDTILKSV